MSNAVRLLNVKWSTLPLIIDTQEVSGTQNPSHHPNLLTSQLHHSFSVISKRFLLHFKTQTIKSGNVETEKESVGFFTIVSEVH